MLRLHDVAPTRVETAQPGLLDAILDLAGHGAAADSRRRTESFRTVKTLKELKIRLEEVGNFIKESTLYLRLLPQRMDSIEGKRHVVTIPVKLLKTDNNLHQDHPDGPFCRANNYFAEQLASLLGLNQVCYLSQDGKATQAPKVITTTNFLFIHLCCSERPQAIITCGRSVHI